MPRVRDLVNRVLVLAGGGTYVLPARRLADNGLDAWAQVMGMLLRADQVIE